MLQKNMKKHTPTWTQPQSSLEKDSLLFPRYKSIILILFEYDMLIDFALDRVFWAVFYEK